MRQWTRVRVAIDFLGNISMRLVGGLVTVGTLAAIYFFVIKPISDTTSDAIDSFNPVFDSIQDAQEQAAQAQKQAQKAAKGGSAQQKNANQLTACLRKAGGDLDRLNSCMAQFSP